MSPATFSACLLLVSASTAGSAHSSSPSVNAEASIAATAGARWAVDEAEAFAQRGNGLRKFGQSLRSPGIDWIGAGCRMPRDESAP